MTDIFVARQPIFDAGEAIAGYELLYRSDGQVARATGSSVLEMASDVLVRAFLGLGLERLTHGAPAFVNFPGELLRENYFTLLDPQSVVIELLESVAWNAETKRACEQMAAQGYRVALDDFEIDEARMPLLEFAEIVKVDVLNRPDDELEALVGALRPYGKRLLAERIETAAVLERCRELGFELFQGYHFARPETISKREIPMEALQMIRLMNLLRDPGTSDAQVEAALRTTPSVAYQLLRIVTSAAVGGRGITSIQHALRIVGRESLHRWLALVLIAAAAKGGGAALERVYTSLRHARMCELLAVRAGRGAAAAPLFLVGLLSRLDAVFRVPMAEIVGQLDLAPEVRAALLGEGGPYAEMLNLVEAYEDGRWDDAVVWAGGSGISPDELPKIYMDSLTWARDQLSLANA